jgi:hypothetical protein
LGTPAGGLTARGASYCKFYQRCPSAMPQCVEDAPPLFQTAPNRITSCYLYRDAPVATAETVAHVFAGGNGAEPRAPSR